MRFFSIVVCILIVFLTACHPEESGSATSVAESYKAAASGSDSDSDNQRIEAVMLEFVEQEEGIEPYAVRMLVTKNHLRIDEGLNDDNFLLLDRVSKDVFSVTHHDQRILKIPHRENLIQATDSIELSTIEKNTQEMPEFSGKKPRHISFVANAETCFDVIAVEGVLEDVVHAIRDYLLTLAGEQTVNLNKTPAEFRTDCMMSNLVYAPIKHLDYGLPLREWDYKGYIRELVNYTTIQAEPTLFTLDPGYQVYLVNAEESTETR